MRRTVLGIVAAALLIVAGAIAIFQPASDGAQIWMFACVRTGLLSGALWLAWPQLSGLHPWLLLAGVIGLFALLFLAKNPRMMLLAAVVAVIVLKLRARKTKNRRSDRS